MNGRNPEHVMPRVWSKGALLVATEATRRPMQPAKVKLSADRLEMHRLTIVLSLRGTRSMRTGGKNAAVVVLNELGIDKPRGLRFRDLCDYALTALAVEQGLLATKEGA